MNDGTAHQPSPAKGKGRGRGRNLAKSNASKAGVKKAPPGKGRGRQKRGYDAKAQAALDRQKELKAAYSGVVNALLPALNDLADRSLETMTADCHAHEKAPAFIPVQSFLDGRLKETLDAYNARLASDAEINAAIRDNSATITIESFRTRCEEVTDEFMNAQLRRLDLLDYLHTNNLPLDLLDNSYDFREITQEKAADLGAHVEYSNGIEVPCAKTLAEMAAAGEPSAAPMTPTKRKAEEGTEGEPAPKRPASATDEAGPSVLPRHIGGLLSAVAPPEEDGAQSPGGGSKMPSPTPQPIEGESPPGSLEALEDDGAKAGPADEERMPPMPTGASEADSLGYRVITKRKTAANIDPNNRIMGPALFEFEPHEIGFRDSSNDKERIGANAKTKRGKYLGTPNSNTMHFDRLICGHDATLNEEDDLDEELVKKHGLHPKYGLFMRNSTSEWEPPKEFVSGMKPVVYYTPNGQTLQSSRSVRDHRLDGQIETQLSMSSFLGALKEFCEAENIGQDEVQPSEEVREKHRQEMLENFTVSRQPPAAGGEQADESADTSASQSIEIILAAAAAADLEEAKLAVIATPLRPTVSRPFDPVRDAFLGPEPSPPAGLSQMDKLLTLAEVASTQAEIPDYRPRHMGSEWHPDRLAAQEIPQTGPPMPAPHVSRDVVPDMISGSVLQPPITFLQTALNSSLYASAGSGDAVPYPGSSLAPALPPPPPPHGMQPDASPARGPFSSPGQDFITPGLPPLRPARVLSTLLEEGQADPSFGGPRHLVMNNTGVYYPPPPPPPSSGRPFTYPPLEQHGPPPPPPPPPPPTLMPLQPPPYMQELAPGPHGAPPLMAGPPPPLPLPLQPVPIQPAPPAGQTVLQSIAPYPGSPPPFHNYAPLQSNPATETSPVLRGATPPTSRHRPSLSSGGSAQSSKWRKLEPAPVPAHRMAWNNNGTELRTVPYDYKEGIKDYTPVEAPPRTGPTTIRGWTHNSLKKPRVGSKSEASPEAGQEKEEAK